VITLLKKDLPEYKILERLDPEYKTTLLIALEKDFIFTEAHSSCGLIIYCSAISIYY